jgi:threonine/homoserine/homoserine lactone efflux protein
MNALHAFAFGFSLAIAIGPIALLIVQNGIDHGLQVAVRSALGAASADWIYALLAFSVGNEIIRALTPHAPMIRRGSGLLLIAIGAWLAWKAVRSRPAHSAPSERVRPSVAGFWITLGLTLSNPLTLAIFLGFAGQLSLVGDNHSVMFYSLCVFLGSLVVQLALALLGASIGKWLANMRVIAMLNFASGIAIVAFGVRGLLVAS